MISEAELMAYLDGDLTGERREEIEKAIANDERLRLILQDEQRVRIAVGQSFDPILEEKVPERLTGLIAKRAVSNTTRPVYPWFGLGEGGFALPIAASLMFGIFMGMMFNEGSSSRSKEMFNQLDSSVVLALDTQLGSAQTGDQPVQIGSTFNSHDGQLCRTYKTTDATGVACNENGQWRLKLYAAREPGRPSQYEQADSASSVVMGFVQEMVAGDPLDAQEEREARDAGWKSGTF